SMTNQPPHYLTVGETALIVRMTPQWVYGAIKRGEFEGVVRNGAVKGIRVPEASVYAYLARKSSSLANAA
ncbi:helix-turn-helix domain-containing protein, partial [Mycobacterium sp.]|uniref:helix-turn-helix transcriptional regulator n=1 Tax=Mycobacterium sp. TaxID=1785 RepID=UPI00260B8EAE